MKLAQNSTFFIRSSFIFTLLLSLLLNSQSALSASPPNNGEEVSIKKMLDSKDKSQQELEKSDYSEDYNVPKDDFERGQPRSAIGGYLRALRSGDLTLATNYLDYRNLSDKTLSVGKEELARQLGVVLNRTLWVDLNSISSRKEGRKNDNLPSYRELVGQVDYQGNNIDVLLQRVPRAQDKVKIWKISNATVEKIPRLFKRYSYSPLGELLAKKLPAVDLFGVMLWQWLYFILMLVLYYFIAKILTWVVAFAIKRVYKKVSNEVLRFIKEPFALLIAVIFARNFHDEANVTIALRAVTEGSTLLIIAWCWVTFRFIDLMKVLLAEKFIAQDKPLAVYLLRPAGTVIKIMIFSIAALNWLENLGFNASTLLAGLGIGGLAIALAAQKTVENIIGAITLYTSAPIRIGNFCRFGNSLGVVEEIGLRATRIRTIDRSVIYVANAKFIDMNIENYSEREKMAFKPKIFLAPDTPKENIDALLVAIRGMLSSTDSLAASPLRSHFKAYTIYGLELDVFAYVNTTDFDVFLDEINQLNLNILALLNEHDCKVQVISERVVE
ncbi:mechanosensitive ion channel family protein [Colwellia sp. Bg11-28]|uniref:mechanosensitive ion channel family protein n=1 Tax=Colwellia sp. Bg11-28 TaxID=2058305 RepID=UPI000C3223DA|nr:mechanosensitive ion channel domain-containing protein [Colwellia sp. Bg11-28]PKH89484.1 mechanosensitive ion channel family protein [Colwellia sp. Bg11-28]